MTNPAAHAGSLVPKHPSMTPAASPVGIREDLHRSLSSHRVSLAGRIAVFEVQISYSRRVAAAAERRLARQLTRGRCMADVRCPIKAMGYEEGNNWPRWFVDDQREASGRPDVVRAQYLLGETRGLSQGCTAYLS